MKIKKLTIKRKTRHRRMMFVQRTAEAERDSEISAIYNIPLLEVGDLVMFSTGRIIVNILFITFLDG